MKQLLLVPGATCLVAFATLFPAQAQSDTTRTLSFSGYEWQIRGTGRGGPGPNQWSPENVWVDKKGQLHLRIRPVMMPATATEPAHPEWQCAEISTKKKLGFGRYEFQVIGPIDRMDRNVVLGLFDYPEPEDGTDGTNEIDIEFARWGNAAWPNGNYTIYPASGAQDKSASKTFEFSLNTLATTQRFTRSSDHITLQSLLTAGAPSDKLIADWTYTSTDSRLIPQKPLPVHLNLWLFGGHPPTDGKEIEIVISKFSFTPEK
jgi:hypothetical protein